MTATGSGSASGPIAATSIVVGSSATSSASTISMKHLITADYVAMGLGATLGSISATTMAPYLSWAQVDLADANAVHDAGIKTQYYVDPNRESVGDPLMPTQESSYAHDCSGNRVTTTYGSLLRYVTDPTSASEQSQFATYVQQIASQAHFDAVFDDDTEPLGSYGTYSPSLPCNYSDSRWLSGLSQLVAASSVPVIVNDLNALNGESVSLVMQLVQSSAWAGSYEECYSNTSQPKEDNWEWQAVENSEIQVNALGKPFQCLGRWPGDASANTDSRTYALASFMLTYDPSKDIFWEEYATPSNFHVMPESQLVAMDPLVSTPSTILGLEKTGGSYSSTYGVFAREYAHCYYAGTYVGACAAVVNTDRYASHAFPLSGYTRTLTMSGYDVLHGGTASTDGPAPPSTMGATEAVIAFK